MQLGGCGCSNKDSGANKAAMSKGRMLLFGIVGLAFWYLLYSLLLPFSHFFAYTLLRLQQGSHLGATVQFFVYDTPKVMLLLTLIVFVVGMVRSFFTKERTRKYLVGRNETIGNGLAALLGIVTPFCSCSAVPLFIGFVQAGVPLGVTFSFLISAPMINEVALVLLYGLVGWQAAAIYLGSGLLIAIVSGWVIGRLHLEHLIEDWVQEMRSVRELVIERKLTWPDRINMGKSAVREIVGKVWLYVIAGIAVGAAIHGYVPEAFMASIMGRDQWWSVPVVVLIGIPMYSNAAGIVPVMEALLGKGAALGTALAFMMSVIALSLPEMVILRKVLKPKLIAVFVAVVGTGILCTGWLFNLLF
jgi:uncharacterized membrane protein YraQ (UPF0718 family)